MKKLNYAIVFTADMKRSVEFYRDVLGFPLKFESPHWTEFVTEGTTLALHPAGETPAGVCVPGLVVEDLEAFHREMQVHGVQCLQQPRQADFGRLALYADLDGLPLSVGDGHQPETGRRR